MRAIRSFCLFLISSVPAFAQAQAPAAPAPRPEPPEFIKQGQQLLREGKPEAALALYRQTIQSSPNPFLALTAAGSVLDLLGRGQEARADFERAITIADTPERRAQAQRAEAMSWAFEGNCAKAVEYQKQVFDYYAGLKDFFQQGETANEVARVCLDSGDLLDKYPAEDLDTAFQWYQLGHAIGLKEPGIAPARVDLWNFRWEHAQARIAARRGKHDEALQHVAAAKAILDKGTNPQQAVFFPYLEGYVAFFARDYKAALEHFSKANQNDAFIQCFLGRTYEALGDRLKAQQAYLQASKVTAHNPAAAYAVPFSRKKLAAPTP